MVAAIEVRGRPAITAPAGWQRVRLDANGTIVELATYIHVVSGDEPASHSWAFNRSSAAVAVIALVRGAATDPVGDATGRINAKSTSIVAPSAAADRDGSLVLAFFGIARATSISPPGGMTEIVEDAASTGRYKATLELAAGSADRGGFGGLVATAGGSSASVAQVLVIRP